MHHYLFDWGDTLMVDLPEQVGPMCDWPVVEPMPRAAWTLCRLSKIARCHLATNARDSDAASIRKALARVGLNEWIENVFCFRSIGFAKPSRQFFDAVAARLSVEKRHLTMVGDDLEKDVLGALGSGLNAVWFHRTGGGEAPTGVLEVSTLDGILDLARAGRGPSTKP
ncbi:MAG: HAD hydrolase-like protein [Holophagales bacterium]|nr:HAD hydrolase-like protein [Holophagales bacterium]